MRMLWSDSEIYRRGVIARSATTYKKMRTGSTPFTGWFHGWDGDTLPRDCEGRQEKSRWGAFEGEDDDAQRLAGN